MAVKSSIQATIDLIATGVANTALKVRNAYNAILNELYSVTTHEVSAGTHANTTSPLSGITYSFWLKKTGNVTVLTGEVYNNNTFSITGGSTLFSLIGSEFSTLTGATMETRTDSVTLQMDNLALKSLTSFPPLTRLRFTLTYFNNA